MYSLSPTNLHLIVKAGSSHPVPGLMRGAEGSGAVPIGPEVQTASGQVYGRVAACSTHPQV